MLNAYRANVELNSNSTFRSTKSNVELKSPRYFTVSDVGFPRITVFLPIFVHNRRFVVLSVSHQ